MIDDEWRRGRMEDAARCEARESRSIDLPLLLFAPLPLLLLLLLLLCWQVSSATAAAAVSVHSSSSACQSKWFCEISDQLTRCRFSTDCPTTRGDHFYFLVLSALVNPPLLLIRYINDPSFFREQLSLDNASGPQRADNRFRASRYKRTPASQRAYIHPTLWVSFLKDS